MIPRAKRTQTSRVWPSLLAAALVLAGVLVPALASASIPAQPETRVRGFDLAGAPRVGAEGDLSRTPRQAYGLWYGGTASGSLVAPKSGAKAGRYEFPDQAAEQTPYVGQSGNIPRRLSQHEKAGRLKPGTETTTEVLGGKTAREIAEHKRIQELTGGVPARQSEKVSNKVDPIGPKRRHLLEEDRRQ